MKKLIAIIMTLPGISFASQSVCDTYYNNAAHYFEIMSTYDNDEMQIQELKKQFQSSKEALSKVNNTNKDSVCEEMNKKIIELIGKYKKI